MITIPTVLILGAGASMGFGYPSGPQLKHDILSSRNSDRKFGFSMQERKIFYDAFSASGKTSVDAFLEHRPGFIDIGKNEIAYALASHENLSVLFDSADNWYDCLYQGMNSSFVDFPKNKISFITFNYDRSLEFYLFNVLKNSYGEKDAEVAEILDQLSIIHVHGKLGDFPWQGTNSSRPYRHITDSDSLQDLQNAAQGIRIISEISDVETNFAPVVPLLQEAKRIVFLGFGYNRLNLERLFFNLDHSRTQYQELYGSCFGLTDLERSTIYKYFLSQGFTNIRIAGPSWKVLQFLRESIVL